MACCARTAPSLSDDAGQFDLGLQPVPVLDPCREALSHVAGLERREPCGRRSGAQRHLADVPAARCLLPPAKPPADAPSSSAASRAPSGPAPATACSTSRSGAPLANRDKLLAVLDPPPTSRPHNNQREGDLRVCVVRRKVSGGTRSDQGRACRDAFLTHMKTCARHGISFWSYLGDRLGIPGAEDVAWLPNLARQRPPAGPLLAPASPVGGAPNRPSKPESRRFIPGFAPLTLRVDPKSPDQ